MNIFEAARVNPVAKGLSDLDLFLLDCLLELKRNLDNGMLPQSGICTAVSVIAKLKPEDQKPWMWHRVGCLVEKRAASWPHHSGDRSYPVPGLAGQHPMDVYVAASAEQKWNKVNCYGALRRDLLDFLIADLRGEVFNERN